MRFWWVALLGVGLFMIPNNNKLPRGIRNNNAGNIRKSGDSWLGLSSVQSDPSFFQFETPVYGLRAIARILKNYETKYGINTVKGLINRWAPPNENDTGAYVAHVARVLGVRPDQKIKVEKHLPALVETIVIHENGYNPYSMETILDGIALA